MKALLVLFTLLVSCNPVDYIADHAAEAAGEECEEVFDRKIPTIRDQIRADVWDICTSYYEDIVLPGLRNVLDDATLDIIAEMERRFEEKLLEAEHEIMGRFGCVVDPGNPSGWNCNDTFICPEQPITCLPAN